MKQLQRTFAVTLLICLLSLNAFGGIMDAPFEPPPPMGGTGDASKSSTQQPTETNSFDPEVQVVLNILKNLLSIF